MKKNDFKKRVNEIPTLIADVCGKDTTYKMDEWGRLCGGVFNYAAICEHNFERNLREDYERKTTFTSDFSIAEWFVEKEGANAVIDTLQRSLISWNINIEYFAELILATNMKSWEWHARGDMAWSKLYAELYYIVKDLYFEWFDESNPDHEKAMDYYMDYVD